MCGLMKLHVRHSEQEGNKYSVCVGYWYNLLPGATEPQKLLSKSSTMSILPNPLVTSLCAQRIELFSCI